MIIRAGPSYFLWEAVSSQEDAYSRIPYFTGEDHEAQTLKAT